MVCCLPEQDLTQEAADHCPSLEIGEGMSLISACVWN